ncbi:hypothetical protein [Natrarchaeobius oligotrophus]|uniref:Uncharacterized protein n=1 Tax=Natrarchaeobius chitinivorans TaxID=1679083 RepID=A0A3N6LU38_NATCH|nr:hypothetical protein [Natrarchaeobius chitinivorans]RQG93748.1 hypothetical protein EA472_22710 [Natrarchaeobius chitinivorans]
MLEPILDHIYELAAVGIAGLGAARFYYGPQFYEIPWQPLRRVFIPMAHAVAKHKLGDEFYAAYETSRREHVATLDVPHEDVVADLEEAGYLVEPLAALKTDWNGNTEVASYARHYGSKPFPGAPEWLCKRQVHVTLFEAPGGGTIVTAHAEANSWRWDLVEEHYRGVGMDIDYGRQEAAQDLGIDPQPSAISDIDES